MMRSVHITFLTIFVLLAAACSQEPETGSVEKTGLESSLGSMAANSSKGAELTRRKCASCHSLDRNIRKVGPTLKGIVGRAPSIEGIPFETWTEEALERWIENPRAIKKKTRMALPGISDPAERKAIIAYLKLI